MARWDSEDLPTEYLAKALIDLLAEKPLSAISVSELTKRAGVARVTFYRNFSSKEEVLERHVAGIVRTYEREVTRGIGFASFIREENIVLLARYFQRNELLVRRLIENRLGDYLRLAMERSVLALSLASERSADERRLAEAYANALFGVLANWTLNGCRDDPKPLARLMCELFQDRMRRY